MVRILRIVRVGRFFMSEDSTWVQKIIDSSYNAVMEVNSAMITAQVTYSAIETTNHIIPKYSSGVRGRGGRKNDLTFLQL